MPRVLVIDNEAKSIDEIQKALISSEGPVDFETFSNIKQLQEKIKEFNSEEKTEFFKFNLCLFNFNEMGFEQWKPVIDEYKALIPAETVICFISYDHVAHKPKKFQEMGVFNVFFKPFDPLILKESLHMALKAKKKVETVELKAQQAKAFVAILKEIELVSISEVGFITMNEGEIPQNSFSKYFSPLFSHGRKQSVWAQCLASIPIPNKPGIFVNKFQYVAVEPTALRDLRTYIRNNKHRKMETAIWNLSESKNKREMKIAFLYADDKVQANFKKDLETEFTNLKVDFIQVDLTKKAENIFDTYDCVICFASTSKFEDLQKRFKEGTSFILIANQALTEEQIKVEAPNYKDIFVNPLDRSYFYKKLKIHYHDLHPKEDIDLLNITSTEKFKAANLIKISEICELYINFNYHRELPFNTNREFIFVAEDENQVIELPGFCNFAEKNKTEGKKAPTFFHQFLFWGMTDHYLKQIRLWLLHNHILNKQGQSG